MAGENSGLISLIKTYNYCTLDKTAGMRNSYLEVVSMTDCKEILRLKVAGMSKTEIAGVLRCGN